MIWLKAFGLALGVGLCIRVAVVMIRLAVETIESSPGGLQVVFVVASVFLATFIWKKVLEKL